MYVHSRIKTCKFHFGRVQIELLQHLFKIMKYENTMNLFAITITIIFSQGTKKSKNLLLKLRTHPLQLSTLIMTNSLRDI